VTIELPTAVVEKQVTDCQGAGIARMLAADHMCNTPR
jgi:hypothetical protein